MATKKVEKQKANLGYRVSKPPSQSLIDKMQDAIVEGIFTPNPGDKIIICRRRGSGKQVSVCDVKSKDEAGHVEVWDDTIHQWFAFNVAEAISTQMVVKVYMKVSPPAS